MRIQSCFRREPVGEVFLSKINKRLIDLALPMIVMAYGGRTILAEVFTILEQCDHALCQHDATDLVSLLVNSSKSQKVPIAAVGKVEVEVDKTLYCWFCGQADHAKNDCSSKQRQVQTVDNLKRKSIVHANDSTQGACNHLPKELKCFHCVLAVQNCFALHPKKLSSLEWGKTLEAKIGALEKMFKRLASSGQILNSPSSSVAQVSSFISDYYMFETSGEVVSSAAVTRAQTVSRTTSLTTRESMENL